MALCSSQITLLTTQMIVTTPKKHSHTLSVRRHNQELSFAPAPRASLRCIVVVVVLGGIGGLATTPGAGAGSLLRLLLEAAAASAAVARRRREGGREEGYVTAKQNTGPPAAKTIAA